MRRLARPAALAALVLLAGCVGAPAPGPVAYTPGYAQPIAPSGYAPGSQVALGGTCFAGVYTCALPQGLPVGTQCSCPGLGAPSYGTVR